MWLMQALGFLLSALPVEDILRNLHSLITPYIQQLEKLTNETVRTSIENPHIHRADTAGLWPRGTGLVSVWCHCSGTFLCVTRLGLTLHFGLVTHIGVTNAFPGFCKDTHKHTRVDTHNRDGSRREAKLGMHKSALKALRAGHLSTCACT